MDEDIKEFFKENWISFIVFVIGMIVFVAIMGAAQVNQDRLNLARNNKFNAECTALGGFTYDATWRRVCIDPTTRREFGKGIK